MQKAFKQIPIKYKGIQTQHVEPYAFDSTDSDFIMSLSDWGKHFNCIFLASDRDEDIEKGKWFSQRKSGTVSGGYTDKFEVRIRKKPLSKEEATRQKMSMTKSKEYATVEMTLWQEDMRLKDGYKSIVARDTMSMIITEKGNDEKIIEAKDIPRTNPPCMQPPNHTGRIFFVYYTTNGNGANLYNSCKSNTFISAEFQKKHIPKEGKKDVDTGWV